MSTLSVKMASRECVTASDTCLSITPGGTIDTHAGTVRDRGDLASTASNSSWPSRTMAALCSLASAVAAVRFLEGRRLVQTRDTAFAPAVLTGASSYFPYLIKSVAWQPIGKKMGRWT